MMDIRVIVAAHKPYTMPGDAMYLPLHVGAEGKDSFGFQGDNTGENISDKNNLYCELTGLYWAWKNLPDDYLGLAHYRRHFATRKGKNPFERILTGEQAAQQLADTDILLPSPRNYRIESVYKHYQSTCYVEPLDLTGDILKEKYPEYVPEFEQLKVRKTAHMFNMFIMKRDKFDAYCQWLFDVLFELEKRVDFTQYDAFHARFFGRVSELLLDVWINTNGYSYTEVPVISMEKVNWLKKGGAFLAARFFGKKYSKSF